MFATEAHSPSKNSESTAASRSRPRPTSQRLRQSSAPVAKAVKEKTVFHPPRNANAVHFRLRLRPRRIHDPPRRHRQSPVETTSESNKIHSKRRIAESSG
ncbi:MAG: hypothetical protein R2724_15755 [Bryobacterales bacterium]